MRAPCQRVQIGGGKACSGNSKSCPAPSRAAALAPAHRSTGLTRQRAVERTHGRGTALCCHEIGTWAATKPRYARAGSSQTCSRPPSFAQDASSFAQAAHPDLFVCPSAESLVFFRREMQRRCESNFHHFRDPEALSVLILGIRIPYSVLGRLLSPSTVWHGFCILYSYS